MLWCIIRWMGPVWWGGGRVGGDTSSMLEDGCLLDTMSVSWSTIITTTIITIVIIIITIMITTTIIIHTEDACIVDMGGVFEYQEYDCTWHWHKYHKMSIGNTNWFGQSLNKDFPKSKIPWSEALILASLPVEYFMHNMTIPGKAQPLWMF